MEREYNSCRPTWLHLNSDLGMYIKKSRQIKFLSLFHVTCPRYIGKTGMEDTIIYNGWRFFIVSDSYLISHWFEYIDPIHSKNNWLFVKKNVNILSTSFYKKKHFVFFMFIFFFIKGFIIALYSTCHFPIIRKHKVNQ